MDIDDGDDNNGEDDDGDGHGDDDDDDVDRGRRRCTFYASYNGGSCEDDTYICSVLLYCIISLERLIVLSLSIYLTAISIFVFL